jgi:hypothetical protein
VFGLVSVNGFRLLARSLSRIGRSRGNLVVGEIAGRV